MEWVTTMKDQNRTKASLISELEGLRRRVSELERRGSEPVKSSAGHELTKAALMESEERFHTAFEATSDCILIWDKEYNYLYANQSAIDHVGTTRDKVIGKNIRDGLGHLPDFLHLWMSRVDKVLATNETLHVQDETILFGEKFHTDAVISPICLPDGSVTAVCAVYRDVTELKQTEHELRLHDETYRTLLDNLNAGVVVHASDTSIISANSAACNLLGLSEDQMKGKKATDPQWKFVNLDNSDMPVDEYPVNRILSTQEPLRSMVVGVNRPQSDGVVWLLVNGCSVPDSSENGEQIIINFNDVTDRIQAERELKHSEDILKESQRIAKLGTLDWDMSTGKLKLSTEILEICGFDQGREHSLEEVTALVHPDDREEVENSLRNAVEGKSKHDMEHRMVRPDGQLIHISATAELIRGDDGTPLRLLGTVLDISERKLIEEEVSREKELTELYINSLHGLFYVFDDKKIVRWNHEWNEVTGFSDEEMAKKAGPDFFEGEDKKLIEEEMARVFRDGSSYAEARLVTKDGVRIPYYFSGARLSLDGKDHLVGLGFDITERKQAEKLLQVKQAQLQAIMDHSPALISIKDLEGTVTLANRNFELLDIPPLEKFIGRSVFETFPAEVAEDLWRNDLAALKAGTPVESEETVAHKDGTSHIYLTNRFPLFDKEGQVFGICAISTDISERVHAEKELENHREHLEELVEERTRELEEKNTELDRTIKVFVGRELKIKDLERRIREKV